MYLTALKSARGFYGVTLHAIYTKNTVAYEILLRIINNFLLSSDISLMSHAIKSHKTFPTTEAQKTHAKSVLTFIYA